MIIQQCDICKRKTASLNTLILYKKTIDYCEKCKSKVEKARQEYKREIEYEYCVLDSRLKSKERNLIKKLEQENYKGIVVKEVH
jgi:hypothetical protein